MGEVWNPPLLGNPEVLCCRATVKDYQIHGSACFRLREIYLIFVEMAMKAVIYEKRQKKISMLEKTFVFCGDREHELLGFKEIRCFMMSMSNTCV